VVSSPLRYIARATLPVSIEGERASERASQRERGGVGVGVGGELQMEILFAAEILNTNLSQSREMHDNRISRIIRVSERSPVPALSTHPPSPAPSPLLRRKRIMAGSLSPLCLPFSPFFFFSLFFSLPPRAFGATRSITRNLFAPPPLPPSPAPPRPVPARPSSPPPRDSERERIIRGNFAPDQNSVLPFLGNAQ